MSFFAHDGIYRATVMIMTRRLARYQAGARRHRPASRLSQAAAHAGGPASSMHPGSIRQRGSRTRRGTGEYGEIAHQGRSAKALDRAASVAVLPKMTSDEYVQAISACIDNRAAFSLIQPAMPPGLSAGHHLRPDRSNLPRAWSACVLAAFSTSPESSEVRAVKRIAAPSWPF